MNDILGQPPLSFVRISRLSSLRGSDLSITLFVVASYFLSLESFLHSLLVSFVYCLLSLSSFLGATCNGLWLKLLRLNDIP